MASRKDEGYEIALQNAIAKGYVPADYLSEAGDVEADLAEQRAEIEEQIAESDSPTQIARLEADLQRMNHRAELRISELQARAQADADRYAARSQTARDESEAKILADQSHAARVQAEELAKLDRTVKLRNDADARRKAREDTAQAKRDKAAREKAAAARSKAVRNAGKSTSLLSTSKDTRFMDAGITALASAVTVVYTATRPGNQSLGFAAFWTLLGALMMVEGTGGELQFIGSGVMSANAAYFGLRLFDLVKVEAAVNNTPIPGTGNQIVG